MPGSRVPTFIYPLRCLAWLTAWRAATAHAMGDMHWDVIYAAARSARDKKDFLDHIGCAAPASQGRGGACYYIGCAASVCVGGACSSPLSDD